jgi:hypothetical protein
MPKKTATIAADPVELLQLLGEWSQFRKWLSLVEAVQGYLKARPELFGISFRLDHAQRNEQTVENQDARFFWHLEANRERVQLNQLQDVSDTDELHWLRAERDYRRLNALIERDYPDLLPLPGLDPLPETADKQVETAERIGRIRGLVLMRQKEETLPEKQQEILSNLEGRAMTGKALAKKLKVEDLSQLQRTHIKPLLDSGRVKNDRKIGGYYRPDSPPRMA